MKKKGFADIGLVMALLLLIAIFALVGFKVFSSYNDKWQQLDVSNDSKTYIQEQEDRYPSLFDGIFMLVFALLVVALFISVTQIGTRPEFFFITIVVLVFFIGASALLGNAFEDISEGEQLNDSSDEFNFIPFIMGNLPIVTLGLGVVVIGGLYLKIKGLI